MFFKYKASVIIFFNKSEHVHLYEKDTLAQLVMN
jgi:hypothetical protein